MKKTISIFALMLSLVSCQTTEENTTKTDKGEAKSVARLMSDPSSFITIDSANKMLTSYLNSINYQNNDTDIQSITFNAADLRRLLDSMTNSSTISEVQIKFAHKLSYINDGNGNQPAGYNYDALTLLLIGVNASGNYVNQATSIMNHGRPCPKTCPPGTAANPLF